MQLGALLTNSQASQEALKLLEKALELAPDDAENWGALGRYYRYHKNLVKCENAVKRALQLQPDNKKILLEGVALYKSLKDDRQALSVAEKLHSLDKDNPVVVDIYAGILDDTGSPDKALKLLSELVAKDQREMPTAVITRWFKLMAKLERNKEARKWLRHQIQANPSSVDLKLIYASSCTTDLDYDDALRVLLEAHELDPTHERVNHDLAVVYRFQGNIAKALEHFEKLLSKDPHYASALRVVGVEHKYQWGDREFNRLSRAAAHLGELPEDKRVQLHYALGKAYDDLGDLASAFEHFSLGGRLHLKNVKTDNAVENRLRQNIRDNLTKEFYETTDVQGCSSEKPVFVVGMPRSGTSLIEQVLSSLPGVYGAGELKYVTSILNKMTLPGFKVEFSHRRHIFADQDAATYKERGEKYIELVSELAPTDSVRIIDKMPANYSWVGFIHLILPNAKFIHSRRHPIETCLSAYRIFFPEGQYWSYDFKMMAKAYREYVEIMDIWKQVIPSDRILEVRYEDMVSDLENQSKRMAEHLSVNWDSRCLQFHKSDRPVRTASVVQVRKPLYSTSTNRWEKYKPYLKPLLDQIGDLVEAYEEELQAS